MVELSIAIPFYNEEKNAPILLNHILKNMDSKEMDYEIIAVNNGSVDKTPEVLRQFAKKNRNIKVVDVEKNIGYGYGVKKGLEAARGKIIGYMWADDFEGAKIVMKLAKILKKSEASLIKVGRLNRQDGLLRKIQSKAYNSLFWAMFGLRSRDVNGCPKIMKNSFYRSIKLKSNDWFLDAEIMLKLAKLNHKFIEVPIIPEKRVYGKSHVKWNTCIEFIKNMSRYRAKGFEYGSAKTAK